MNEGMPVNGEALLAARIGKLWTLRELADKCQELGQRVDYSNLSKYERGETRPQRRTLHIIAKALGVPVSDLLLPDEPNGADAA